VENKLIFILALSLSLLFLSQTAFAANSAVFDPQDLIIKGIALVPLISLIISIAKKWLRLKSQYVPLVNVGLGGLAVLLVALIEQGMNLTSAAVMTLGIVLGSQAFHETFGHALNILLELVQKKFSRE